MTQLRNLFRFKKPLVWVLAFAVLGGALLLLTHAATVSNAIEPEKGTLSGNTMAVADANASGGNAVNFFASNSGGGMELVSRSVPLFTATNSGGKEAMRDTEISSGWSSGGMPTWAAFDLSFLNATQKQKMLLSANCFKADAFLLGSGDSGVAAPADYVIEVNGAAGGGAAPSSGWVAAVTVNNSLRGSIQKTFSMSGFNWVRLNVTRAVGNANEVAINLDIYTYGGSVPSDDWLVMGDSITYGADAAKYGTNLQEAVSAQTGGARWPAHVEDGIPGINSGTALGIINDRLANFPGKYVVLGFGTNDAEHTYTANMESLVKSILAAGKVPAIPHMPWAPVKTGSTINQQIDALYAKYPQIVRGPDLWGLYFNRLDLFQADQFHPNAAGSELWRQEWAKVIRAQPK